MNCFPQVQGYYTALERTMFLHHATDDHLKIWEINLATHYKGLTLIRPGVKYVFFQILKVSTWYLPIIFFHYLYYFEKPGVVILPKNSMILLHLMEC